MLKCVLKRKYGKKFIQTAMVVENVQNEIAGIKLFKDFHIA